MNTMTQDKMHELFHQLQNTGEVEAGKIFAELLSSFSLLRKEEQNKFTQAFNDWVETSHKKNQLMHAYAQLLKLAEHFYAEHHETVLAEAAEVRKVLAENNDAAAAIVPEIFTGSIYRTLGNVDLALKLLWEGYRYLSKEDRFGHFKMACGFHIGSIYIELNNHEEALPILQQTLELAEEVQDSVFIVYTSHGLGKWYLKNKNYENARVLFVNAMEAADKINNAWLISVANTELGNYYFETGDYEEAEALHKRAVESRLLTRAIGGAITNYIRLAEIKMKQSEPDEAKVILNKALLMAEQIKVKPKMYAIHLLLSDIYHCKKDLLNSLFHYKQYHYLQDEAMQEENAKKVKNIKLVFEAEQTKKENAIIKKQKAEIQRKNTELQDTIDELTITKAGKKAKAFTLLFAIVFFVFEDSILHFVFHFMPANNFWISLAVKMVIIFSLKPINSAIEHYLVKKVVKRKKRKVEDVEEDTGTSPLIYAI